SIVKQLPRHSVIDDIDLLGRISVELHDLVLHHSRVGDYARSAAACQERFFQGEGRRMFAIEEATDLRHCTTDFVAPLQPRTVDAVPGPINVATPYALEAQENVAFLARDFLQFIGKPDPRLRIQALNGSESPFGGWPFCCGE